MSDLLAKFHFDDTSDMTELMTNLWIERNASPAANVAL